jgi:ABC-type multidrug transport system fused ATPase/permease subunit
MKQNTIKNPYLDLLSIAWKYTVHQRGRYLLVYAMFMCSNIAMACYPILWGVFVNAIQIQGTDVLKSAWIYALAYLGLRLIDWSFHGPARLMERELAFNMSRNFLQEMYHKVLHLPVTWHQDHHSGATINRIRKSYEALRDFFQRGFEYLQAFFKFIFSFAAMIYFVPAFGLLAAFMGFWVVWIILRFDRPYIKTQAEVNDREHVVSSTLFDSLSNIVTVITLRLEQRMESGLMRKVMDILPPFKKNVAVNEWKWFVTEMMVGLIYGIILIGYIWQNWKPGETFLLGGLVMLIGYVERFASVFHSVAYLYTDVVRYRTDIRAADPILEAWKAVHASDATVSLPSDWNTIEVRHLNFTHKRETAVNGQSIPGLHDIHLQLHRGQRIALIGESGSGKSTILALLRGLYQAEPGLKIAIDGIQQDGLNTLSDHVTLFPQDPEIFENTIEYNITLGLPFDASELEDICQTVHFSEVAAQLPNGLQSNIMEKGVNLSGGQKQRLALARGVLAARDSDIILLDEPTSSVDPKTELKIYDQLFEAFKNKVVVSALHRLHLLTRFDYIYVLDQGRVVEEGSLPELLEQGPVFRELWRHQDEVTGTSSE